MKIYHHKTGIIWPLGWLELHISMRSYIAIFRYGLEFRLFGKYYCRFHFNNGHPKCKRLIFKVLC